MSERTVATAAGRLVAGIDSSTQSCKVELRDAVTGELRGTGAAPHQPVTPPKSEQNPADWWDALVLAFGRALEAASAGPGDIAAISVGAQCHGLVALDEDNQVIRPAKLWNDTTSTPELITLRAAIGDDQMIQRLGTLPTAAFTITKIAWLAAHEPENFAKVRHILLPHDYLTFRLTGAYVTDRSEASGTGYFDDAANVYLPEFLAHVDAERDWLPLLPTVLGPNDIAGTVHDEALAALGLTGEIVVGAGGGDQHIAALGLGTGLGDVVYSFGTSGVVSVLHDTDVHDPEGLVNGVADCAGEFMPLICTLNAAKVTDTFGRILGVDHAELAKLALSAPVDSIGPSLAAFLDGERTPNRPGASGIIAGITTETTREEIARATYEGVIFGLVAGQKQLERLGVGTDGRIIAVGGGAKSPAYTQLLADALGRTILTADAPEATARGAAVQASAIATGRPVTEVRTLWAPATAVAAEPRPVTRDAWSAYEAVAAVSQLDRV